MRPALPWLSFALLLFACDDGQAPGAEGVDTGLAPDATPGKSDGTQDAGPSPRPDAARPASDAAPDSAPVEPDARPPEPDAGPPPPEADAGPLPPEPEACPAPGAGAPDPEARRDGRWVVVEAFPSAALGNTRPVVVYLPAAYDADPEARFPVMYFHDGQNLFDPAQSAFGHEWGVDETVDTLIEAGRIPPLIVVGVYNTEDRMSEYTPTVDRSIGDGGRAGLYARFLVEELKPWIDAHLRTQCGPTFTGVAGSSLGGLLSLDLLRGHPEVFGRVGCLSSSLWWDGGVGLGFADEVLAGWRRGLRLWIDAGTEEGNDSGTEDGANLDPDGDGTGYMVGDARTLRDTLLDGGIRFGEDLGYLEDLGAAHEEAAWAGRLPAVLTFLWGERPLPAVESLRLRAYAEPLAVGRTTAMAVEAFFRASPLVMTVPPGLLETDSSDTRVAAFTPTGAARGVAVGEATLSAAWQGASAELAVRVVDPDDLQAEITFIVSAPPWTPPDAPLFLAGNLPELGGWEADGLPLAHQPDGNWHGTLTLRTGTEVELKVTRGSWDTVEKGPDGEEVPNRTFRVEGDSVERYEVAAWADD